ncbi:acyltransferase, WS/DGAT/MGAT [Mycobacterium sp. 283mftsu]|nr:acyltransferase, WS/DGAT/MGAT [Mycobacterium sp. 283mftsu]
MKKRMTLLDSGFIWMERHESPQHGTALVIFRIPDGSPPDYMQRLATHLRSFPVTADPFNWRLSKSLVDKVAPAWEVLPPEDIELDYHFRHSALPQPGGELELALVVSRLATHPTEFDRPPWEVHLIEGLEHGRFAMFMKMHHSLIDGMSAVKMIRNWLSDDPTEAGTPPMWAMEAEEKPRPSAAANGADESNSTPTTLGKSGLTPSNFPGAIGRAAESAMAIGRATRTTIAAATGTGDGLVAPYNPPRTILNGKITQRRRISTQRVELARMKAIAKRIDGTLNDAIATVFSGALKRYLTELDALPDRSLVAGVLASLRATVDPTKADTAGNVISFIFSDLATDVDDIGERARRVVASTRAGKDHLLGLKSDAMNYSILMLTPSLLTTVTGTGNLLPMFNVALSNVPGINVPVYWNGALAEALHATTVISNGQALIVAVTSWVDQLCFTFTACPDTIPHPQRLSVYLMDALDEAEESLGI